MTHRNKSHGRYTLLQQKVLDTLRRHPRSSVNEISDHLRAEGTPYNLSNIRRTLSTGLPMAMAELRSPERIKLVWREEIDSIGKIQQVREYLLEPRDNG